MNKWFVANELENATFRSFAETKHNSTLRLDIGWCFSRLGLPRITLLTLTIAW